MIAALARRRWVGFSCIVALATAPGCGFQGVNSLALPGAAGRGPDASIYHVEIANVGALESNSPVFINDVVVGSVGKMTLKGWHADVEISVQPDVSIPANAVATIGQTSLLGSMHLALDQPLGEQPSGQLSPGATIPMVRTSTYPSTEQTLSSLSVVVNGGGLGQVGDIIQNFNAALSGREGDFRELLANLDDFVGVLDRQRDNIVASMEALDRFSGTFAGRRDVLDQVLRDLPPALDVLIRERPRLTTALQKLGQFSDTASQLVNDAGDDIVKNLQNLAPAIRSLADIGPDLNRAIAAATVFPFTQNIIDRAFRGDYMNLSVIVDLTVPRLKRTLFLGTRWGEEGATLVPAPGDPWYLNYTYEPLSAPISPPPQGALPGDPATANGEAGSMPGTNGPLLPVAPPSHGPSVTGSGADAPIFAGPYPGVPQSAAPGDAPVTTGDR